MLAGLSPDYPRPPHVNQAARGSVINVEQGEGASYFGLMELAGGNASEDDMLVLGRLALVCRC